MNARELRIGNYVNYDFDNMVYKKGILRVDCDVFTHIKSDGGMLAISPIPLTQKFLKRLGFENVNNESWFWHIDFDKSKETFKVFPLTAAGEPLGLWGIVGCPPLIKKIEFVHQLQNLYFALTGEELILHE